MPKSELLEFGWTVPEAGFQWVEVKAPTRPKNKRPQQPERGIGENEPRWALVAGGSDREGTTERRYNPFQVEPALFLVFSQIRPTQEGIQEFANQYGSLGVGKSLPRWEAGTRRERGRATVVGELLDTWERQIADMREMVRLWELCQRGNAQELAKLVEWSKDGQTVLFRSPNHLPQWIAKPGLHAEWLDRFTPGDVLLPALVYLQRVVNAHMGARATPQLLWDLRGNGLVLNFLPASLLSMLWLQFADAISGNKVYHACQGCGKWLLISPEAARTNRQFCSNACRMKALRGRQDKARQLHAAGESVEVIAQKLSSDVFTVTGWITGRKQAVRQGGG